MKVSLELALQNLTNTEYIDAKSVIDKNTHHFNFASTTAQSQKIRNVVDRCVELVYELVKSAQGDATVVIPTTGKRLQVACMSKKDKVKEHKGISVTDVHKRQAVKWVLDKLIDMNIIFLIDASFQFFQSGKGKGKARKFYFNYDAGVEFLNNYKNYVSDEDMSLLVDALLFDISKDEKQQIDFANTEIIGYKDKVGVDIKTFTKKYYNIDTSFDSYQSITNKIDEIAKTKPDPKKYKNKITTRMNTNKITVSYLRDELNEHLIPEVNRNIKTLSGFLHKLGTISTELEEQVNKFLDFNDLLHEKNLVW